MNKNIPAIAAQRKLRMAAIHAINPRFWISVFALVIILRCFPAYAMTIEPTLSNPQDEARAQSLFHDIRCVVCQSESIAESQAEVAGDMRRDIRTRIGKGESDEAIRHGLALRYGDFILMQPPFKQSTALLWVGPLLALAAGLLVIGGYFRKKRA